MKRLLTFLLLTAALTAGAQVPERPAPPKLVNDLAGILSPQQESALEQKLVALDDTTGNQIVVLTVSSLGDYQPWEFGHMVIEQWGVGTKGRDNGVVLLVKPKTGSEKGEVYISVGYGLEGAIPDATARQIVEQEIIPAFRNNDYYGGIDKGASILASLAAGEYSAAQWSKKAEKNGFSAGPVIVIIIVIIILSLFRGGKKRHKAIGRGIPGWAWLILMSQMGRSHSGSWGDFSGGSGGFGGGGGGFGGFGGGRSGGGGAGGSW